MTQHGFFYDQSRCSGCQACAVACKSWKGIPPGPVKLLRVYEHETGAFPDVRLSYYWLPCFHCESPACVSACPTEALYKEDKYGAVRVKPELCDGCRLCYDACPYGSPMFESDGVATVQKCDLCYDRLESGLKPICALSCPDRALDFGPLDELEQKYGPNRDLPGLPACAATRPATIFKPQTPKRRLVAYDSDRARVLMMRRDPLPAVYSSPAEVTSIPAGMIARTGLVIKHQSNDEMLRRTRNDEG